MNTQITIRMPKELLAKWLAALRSGEYKQARNVLRSHDGTSHCCLGVLVDVTDPSYLSWTPLPLTPSGGFLRKHGIEFAQLEDPNGNSTGKGNPYLPHFDTWAAVANDGGRTFAEIADAIEACAEGT